MWPDLHAHMQTLGLYRTLQTLQSDNSFQLLNFDAMKNSIFSLGPWLGIFLVCSGCGSSMQKKLTGKWVIDQGDDIFEMMGDEGDASVSQPRFTLEFLSGGVFRSSVIASGHQQQKEGRWFFVEGAADICKIRVSINSDNSEFKPDIVLTEVKFLDEKTIELVPPNVAAINRKMTFRKAN